VSLSFVTTAAISAVILLLGRGFLGVGESFIITGAQTWGLALLGVENTSKVLAWVGSAMFAALALGAPLGAAIYGMFGFNHAIGKVQTCCLDSVTRHVLVVHVSVQYNTLGLGDNVPISTANLNDGFAALKDGQMVMLRIPYPMGFYAKGLDGRIDDAAAGWKGRGLWSTSGDRTPWLMEGGKGAKPRAVHIQLRPDPLAR
jgi:MFS family permease